VLHCASVVRVVVVSVYCNTSAHALRTAVHSSDAGCITTTHVPTWIECISSTLAYVWNEVKGQHKGSEQRAQRILLLLLLLLLPAACCCLLPAACCCPPLLEGAKFKKATAKLDRRSRTCKLLSTLCGEACSELQPMVQESPRV
jgi:hypothetical protein